MSEIGALLGRVVAGKFAIEEHVGGGAMGEVFRARHIVLDTAIALKIMRADIAKDAMFKERFYREAKAASRLEHPNSVRVLDFGVEADGLVYIAMEYLHGRDLLAVLRAEWPFSDERIVDLLVQTLAAVSVAHELGIVHRDLKPENIMVSIGAEDDGARPYHVKVCDFGIAKVNDPRGFQTDSGKALTSSGTLIGTPEYMSPEQSRGDPLDARSDLYSLGIVLYQLLVGRVPFTAENALGVVLKQVTDEPVPPSKVRPGVNPRLEAICMRALKKSREERYQTAKEMRRDLRGVLGYRPNSGSDESGARLLPVEASGADASSALTLVQAADGEAITEVDRSKRATEDAAKRDGDFAPKQTSDGTELTLPIPAAQRHLGAIVAVGSAALVIGALGFVLFARSASVPSADVPPVAAASGASASPSATLPPAIVAVAEEGSPVGAVGAVGAVAEGKRGPSPSTKPSGVVASGVVASGAKALTSPASGGAATSALASAKPTATATASAAAAPGSAAPAADPSYNPAGAYVVLGMLQRERVREDVVQGKMSAALPKLSGCYRSALRMAGAPVPGSAEIHMSIDDKGNVTTFVNAPKHPQFARCAQEELAGMKIPVAAIEAGPSGATVTQWLTLHP
jgi:serine/threonine-protein kinase